MSWFARTTDAQSPTDCSCGRPVSRPIPSSTDWTVLLVTRRPIRQFCPHRMNPLKVRLRVNEHLEVLDEHFNPISGVYAIGDNAMPVSGRLPATAQGELRPSARVG